MRQTTFKEQDHFERHTTWAEKAHEKFLRKLTESLTERHRASLLRGLITASQSSVILGYTLGNAISQIQSNAKQLIDDVLLYINETDANLTKEKGLEWYINCLWYLSFCYFFDISKDKVQTLADHISLTGKDMLIDRLIAASIPDHPIAIGKLAFPEVYKPLADALSLDQPQTERNEKILLFLKNYYPLLKKYDVTWHDSHKEEDPEYCYHFGYWIFELGALVASIGWDDTAFRNHEFYPKDLVDWKFAQRLKDQQYRI